MPVPVVEDRNAPLDLSDDLAATVARRLTALAEPTRLRLANELRARDDASVHELADAVGGSLPNISKHLRTLHDAGLVTRRKEGTFVHYRIANQYVGALVGYAVVVLGNTRRFRPPVE
jgi:DNA-binding transcriptional ArsR family regulator